MTNNQIEKVFEGHTIRFSIDEQGKPWCVAKDLGDALGLKNTTIEEYLSQTLLTRVSRLYLATAESFLTLPNAHKNIITTHYCYHRKLQL